MQAVIGTACKNAPACGADTAVRRATAAWAGAVISSDDEAAATSGESQDFGLASKGGAAEVRAFHRSQAIVK
jgi:hypothetical protein